METTSTSSKTALVTPIVLRAKKNIRLLFCPMLINNPNDSRHSVKGTFIYQKKLADEEWVGYKNIPLSWLKADEGYKLELSSSELFTLFREVRPLYEFVRERGIPYGRRRWVRLQHTLAAFLKINEKDLTEFLNSNTQGAADSLSRILRWLSTAPRANEVAAKLTRLDPKSLPDLNALVGLSAIKEALTYWRTNQENPSEPFWQTALSERTFVLSQVFAYPVVKIGERMYVGGKRLDDKGGGLVDFVARTRWTGSVILVEIKTPQTKLLGSEYRSDAFPLSTAVSGAIAQALRYRQTFMREFRELSSGGPERLLSEPRCLVIAGNVEKELQTEAMRNSFELHRERLQGITLIGYDELFERLKCTVRLLEGNGSDPTDEDLPF